uniref:hypothetical protein n=1 Tax=Serratia entomophila TaxID=42906 RepID=UPI001F4C50DF|nr:hypothetical protein [Serratia entomophila]
MWRQCVILAHCRNHAYEYANCHKSAGQKRLLWLRHGGSLPFLSDSAMSFPHQFDIVVWFLPFFDVSFSFRQALINP